MDAAGTALAVARGRMGDAAATGGNPKPCASPPGLVETALLPTRVLLPLV